MDVSVITKKLIDTIGQLEMTGDDARYGDVFVERFPTEGVTVQSQGYLSQFLLRRIGQNLKSIRGETDNAAIRQFDEDGSFLGPCSDSGGFDRVISGG
jgi:hypothetical protein